MPFAPYVNPRWIMEGMFVWVRACKYVKDANPTAGLRCTVVTACGDVGRIVNEKRGIDEWRSIWDMYVPPTTKPTTEV